MILNVKRLQPHAKLPTIAHPGEDLGYDVYALEDIELNPFNMVSVRTGIAIEAGEHPRQLLQTCSAERFGFLIRDRSSMAKAGVAVFGGVIDAGYRGEIFVTLRNMFNTVFLIHAGDKIAQLIPVPVFAGRVEEVGTLSDSCRRDKAFGSSGK